MVPNTITISARDMRRLETLLDTSLTYAFPRERARLGAVLAHASIAPEGTLPRAIVTMGSSVTCRVDTDRAMEVTLVYPWDAAPEQGLISVLSPLGMSLLGLPVGSDVDWDDEDGLPHTLRVYEVVPPRND